MQTLVHFTTLHYTKIHVHRYPLVNLYDASLFGLPIPNSSRTESLNTHTDVIAEEVNINNKHL